jgi:hypothetical protein
MALNAIWTRSAAATAALAFGLAGCGGETPPPPKSDTPPPAAPPVAGPKARPEGPLPAILMVQAQFVTEGGKPRPGPAKLTIWRTDGTTWWDEVLEDPDSNVFHKAMAWRDGILTIGGEKATVKYWTQADGKWTGETLAERSWGGKFDRFRDVEIGDVDGDGEAELALATHDQGVVAVADHVGDSWTLSEFDQKADTFVHEVEIGDVDGDGKLEFYVTPSDRNRASGESQPGGVARYDHRGDGYQRSQVAQWENSHAKEILVANTGAGDQLFVVIEAHTEKNAATGAIEIVDPVRILRLDPPKGPKGAWSEVEVARLEDQQCRFLLPGDVDGDGQVELIAAGMKSGLWVLQPGEGGTFTPELVDANSGGFEHATHVADLDGDGKLEIYVAADNQHEFRRYTWTGSGFARKVIARIPDGHITWNLQDAKL